MRSNSESVEHYMCPSDPDNKNPFLEKDDSGPIVGEDANEQAKDLIRI